MQIFHQGLPSSNTQLVAVYRFQTIDQIYVYLEEHIPVSRIDILQTLLC